MAVSIDVCEIFSVKEWCDLENRVRVRCSVVPRQWKSSCINPLPKAISPATCQDYRPISITSILSRVMEKSLVTRHSLFRAKGEVFVLLLLFCSFFCQRFLDNPRANSRQFLHAGVFWFRMCLLPFWGSAAPCGRKKGEMKFLLLWESMGNFCILAVFERYLSNACTDPHQILFM